MFVMRQVIPVRRVGKRRVIIWIDIRSNLHKFFLDEKQPNPSKPSNLNKTKTSDKKQKPNVVDDTKQPGRLLN